MTSQKKNSLPVAKLWEDKKVTEIGPNPIIFKVNIKLITKRRKKSEQDINWTILAINGSGVNILGAL